MADITYTVNQDSPENIPGFEQYSQEDKALINSFQVNSVFNTNKNYSELHILSLSDELLESVYNYTNFTQLGNAQSSGQEGASILTIDPIADSKAYGYENGGVKLLYHFLDDLYTEDSSKVEFYIQDISPDRTELSLATLLLTSQSLVDTTAKIKANLESQSYFTGFRLDFKNNDLFIATNIDTLDSGTGKVIVVKLYEPLPDTYGIKNTLNIVGEVSDSVAYEIDALITITPPIVPTLRSPNFNIDVTDESVIPTGYYNYNELFSYPVNNANSQIYSTVNEKGIDISVDYADFTDFIHFSSAQERLLNFKYKLDLITSYSASLSSIAASTTGLQGISGSRTYYENLQSGVVSNFDHYERFLYYESGSGSWPKSNTTKPYINKVSTSAEAITWYAGQISNAIEYDLNNYNSLVYSIPTYLRDDANNENYLTFVYMVGQHFDNLWLYSKAVTDKYDADNRIDKGISKDLVAEALKNFGVKLYTSNKSVEDLFSTFIGQAYQSGSEKIKTYITGSLTGSNTPIQPSSFDNYQKEVQKRIYHNLPLLLKSKGTERGLRALINCLGIPGDILDIKLYGGRNIDERPFFGDYQYYTSSLDKIRLDNTGSIVTGSTLSNYVSIVKRDQKYTDDLHVIEVGFSPTDNVDNYIISKQVTETCYTVSIYNNNANPQQFKYTDCTTLSQIIYTVAGYDTVTISAIVGTVQAALPLIPTFGTQFTFGFDIDNYLGDPSNLTLDNYSGLNTLAESTLSGSLGTSGSYDLRDYVRLIKFFDNTVFKMVKDFIPARAVADTGIIIKPNLLNRSKAKSVTVSVTQPEYTASIDTAFISGSDGGSFGANGDFSTAYAKAVQTPLGIGSRYTHSNEQAKYDGELDASIITVSNGELNQTNTFKFNTYKNYLYDVVLWNDTTAVCVLGLTPLTPPTAAGRIYVTSSTYQYPANYFIAGGINSTSTYKVTQPNGVLTAFTPPLVFNGYAQYQNISFTVTNTTPAGCTITAPITYGICSIVESTQGLTQNIVAPSTTQVPNTVNIANWFTINQAHTKLKYDITVTGQSTVVYPPAGYAVAAIGNQPNTAINYTFPTTNPSEVTIVVRDEGLGNTCNYTKVVQVNTCTLLPRPFETGTKRWTFTRGTLLTPTVSPFTGNPTNTTGLAQYFTGTNANTLYTVATSDSSVENQNIFFGPSTNAFDVMIPDIPLIARVVITATNGAGCTSILVIEPLGTGGVIQFP